MPKYFARSRKAHPASRGSAWRQRMAREIENQFIEGRIRRADIGLHESSCVLFSDFPGLATQSMGKRRGSLPWVVAGRSHRVEMDQIPDALLLSSGSCGPQLRPSLEHGEVSC